MDNYELMVNGKCVLDNIVLWQCVITTWVSFGLFSIFPTTVHCKETCNGYHFLVKQDGITC